MRAQVGTSARMDRAVAGRDHDKTIFPTGLDQGLDLVGLLRSRAGGLGQLRIAANLVGEVEPVNSAAGSLLAITRLDPVHQVGKAALPGGLQVSFIGRELIELQAFEPPTGDTAPNPDPASPPIPPAQHRHVGGLTFRVKPGLLRIAVLIDAIGINGKRCFRAILHRRMNRETGLAGNESGLKQLVGQRHDGPPALALPVATTL